MRTYNITRSQASDIHNGLCYIKNSISRLEDVLNPDALKDLKYGVKAVENVRKYLYDIIDAEDEYANDKAMKYGRSTGIKNTVWSCYDHVDFDSPHGFPVGTAIECIDSFSSVPIKGTTWGELWHEIDVLVAENSDEFGNHIFIEGFKYVEKQNRVVVAFGS